MEQEKYEKLIEEFTAELKIFNGNFSSLVCEIIHLRKVIEKAEQSVQTGGKQKIEKRLGHGRKSV